MPRIIKGKNEKYRLEEDWKINAWDKDGKLIIEAGKPIM